MMEFIYAVNFLLDGVAKERKLTKDVSEALQATTDDTTRATAAEANFKVLEEDLFMQKKDVSRLTTEHSAANVRIVELER